MHCLEERKRGEQAQIPCRAFRTAALRWWLGPDGSARRWGKPARLHLSCSKHMAGVSIQPSSSPHLQGRQESPRAALASPAPMPRIALASPALAPKITLNSCSDSPFGLSGIQAVISRGRQDLAPTQADRQSYCDTSTTTKTPNPSQSVFPGRLQSCLKGDGRR